METRIEATTINKYIHVEVMGKCWHEELPRTQEQKDTNNGDWYCSCGEIFKVDDWPDKLRAQWLMIQHLKDYSNNYYASNYLEDPIAWHKLLTSCLTEWEEQERNKFYNWMIGKLDAMNAAHTPLTSFKELFEYLLADLPVLPKAVYAFMREK